MTAGRKLRGSVVVVLGASSGVGRAAALMFAEHGARVVVAARNAPALEIVAAECRRRGGIALAVATDLTSPEDIEHLADTAIAEFGHVDTWVNTASVLSAGQLGDERAEELEQLLAANVTGLALASRTALRHFRDRGSGVLINVSSLLGLLPSPIAPIYCMSKFAIRGLSLSLHHATAGHGIRVCSVLPGPIDTPMFEASANHTGRGLRAIPPAISPERVAARVVVCAKRPRREVTVGVSGRGVLLLHRLAPRLVEWAVASLTARLLITQRVAADTTGNLFRPAPGARVDGGWRLVAWRRSAGDALGRWLGRRGMNDRARVDTADAPLRRAAR